MYSDQGPDNRGTEGLTSLRGRRCLDVPRLKTRARDRRADGITGGIWTYFYANL